VNNTDTGTGSSRKKAWATQQVKLEVCKYAEKSSSEIAVKVALTTQLTMF